MSDKKPTVLVVGQCAFDYESIGTMLSESFGADVGAAATCEEAFQAVLTGHCDLVLVNRILDADGTSGLNLIRQWQTREETRATLVMLVSDYSEAQDAAVALGANRGFGKDTLNSAATRDVLAALLGHKRRQEDGGPRHGR